MTRKLNRTKKIAFTAIAVTLLVSSGAEIKLVESQPSINVLYQKKSAKIHYSRLLKKQGKRIEITLKKAEASFGAYPQFMFPGG